MCEPMSIMAGIAGAQAIMGGIQADEMAEAEEQRHEAEVQRAKRDAEIQQNILDQQALDESSKLQREREALALEGLRSQASLKVSGAEAGVGGVSSIRSFLSSDIYEDQQSSTINMNEQTRLSRHQAESRGLAQNTSDRIYASSQRVADAKRQRFGATDYLVPVASGAGQGFLMKK